MHYVSILLMISLLINSHLAMAADRAAHNSNDIWRQQLIPLCENYARYLPNQYACYCTSIAHRLCRSVTRIDEMKKLKHLGEVKGYLASEKSTARDLYDFMTKTMGPYIDDYGQTFINCAKLLLEPHLADQREPLVEEDVNQEEEWPECVVCMEAEADSVFLPCGHLIVCHDCAHRIKSGHAELCCSICRVNAVAVEQLAGERIYRCQKCFANKPNVLLNSCRHLSLCEACANGIGGDVCPLCAQVSSTKTKVFSN